ncbi:MAG: phosphoribosylaminoimidazolesuccinocarboxamide synthase, partial [Chloroflexota bacterium]
MITIGGGRPWPVVQQHNPMSLVRESALPLPLLRRGKVRDTYDLGSVLLMVATDRISAFDVVLPSLIPDKGKVLNRISAFWFEKTAHVMPNHLVSVVTDVAQLLPFLPPGTTPPPYIVGRSMLVKKALVLPVECVARGYLYGSAWEEYQEKGEAFGHTLPSGLREAEKLPRPLFTPTTKAEIGHDQPLTIPALSRIVGAQQARKLEEETVAIYLLAQEYALGRGVIIADTKFEFGLTPEGLLL